VTGRRYPIGGSLYPFFPMYAAHANQLRENDGSESSTVNWSHVVRWGWSG
jgi:hypothetical protein